MVISLPMTGRLSNTSTAEKPVAVQLTMRDWAYLVVFVIGTVATGVGGMVWITSAWKTSLERDIRDAREYGERNQDQIRDLVQSQEKLRDAVQEAWLKVATDVGTIKGQLSSIARDGRRESP